MKNMRKMTKTANVAHATFDVIKMSAMLKWKNHSQITQMTTLKIKKLNNKKTENNKKKEMANKQQMTTTLLRN